jgi:NADH:ubiquinone reductase (H+-translocating)
MTSTSEPDASPRTPLPTRRQRPRILIVGGGYVGMYTALRLTRRLLDDEAEVTVVDPRSYMTYQPFLPEAAAGWVQPRHVVVPLRRVLRGVHVVSGAVTKVDRQAKLATVRPLEGEPYELGYDQLVLAAGSIARTLPIPGLAEWGTGFKTVEEAIQLRNRVLECLDIADSTRESAIRRRNLSFVVVGGGYAGIEALAELEDMARYATRYYPTISPEDLHWVLVEVSDRILPEVGEDLGRYTLQQLANRRIDCRLQTRLESCVGGHIVLSDGTEFDAETLVWTAGVTASPVVADTGLPLDAHGRVRATAFLQVEGRSDTWVAGDCAAVPDLTVDGDAICAPSAQHAVRQAKVLADNLLTVLRGGQPRPYRHKDAGSVASLGLYKGVAQIYGVKVKGFPAWFMHRTYHMSQVPTLARKTQVVLDWTQALFFKREVVSLWTMHEPFREFADAASRSPMADPAPPPTGTGSP